MNTKEKISNFLWNSLYDRCSIVILNVHNLLVLLLSLASLIYFSFDQIFKDFTASMVFAFYTYGFFIYIILFIVFILENFIKSLRLNDCSTINNKRYRIICIVSVFLALAIIAIEVWSCIYSFIKHDEDGATIYWLLKDIRTHL